MLKYVYIYFLQVQSNHFEAFFAPELDKHGYQALYKRKTNEVSVSLFFLLPLASYFFSFGFCFFGHDLSSFSFSVRSSHDPYCCLLGL